MNQPNSPKSSQPPQDQPSDDPALDNPEPSEADNPMAEAEGAIQALHRSLDSEQTLQ